MESKPSKARILIIDDEIDFIEPIAYWFTTKGYEVSKVNSGKIGIDVVKKGEHDAIFLDVNMPEMDGIETLRRIRAINKTIPVILVTAAVDDENRFSGAKALGIAGFFPKGGSLIQLGDLLEISLRRLRKPKPEENPSDDLIGPMRWIEYLKKLFNRSGWKNPSSK